jgi:hypothetical protein
VRLPPVYNQTPIGSGVFSYNPDRILLSESGVPGVVSPTARYRKASTSR